MGDREGEGEGGGRHEHSRFSLELRRYPTTLVVVGGGVEDEGGRKGECGGRRGRVMGRGLLGCEGNIVASYLVHAMPNRTPLFPTQCWFVCVMFLTTKLAKSLSVQIKVHFSPNTPTNL